MKISINENGLVPIHDLEYGDVYLYNDVIYMRCYINGGATAVRLCDGAGPCTHVAVKVKKLAVKLVEDV